MELNRPLLKQQAKGLIGVGQPSALAAGAIYVALGALMAFLSARLVGVTYETAERILYYYKEENFEAVVRLVESTRPSAAAWGINLLLQLTMMVVGAGFTIFVLNTVRGTLPVLGNLLDGFAILGRVLLLELVTVVLVTLWSLLLIVPGIIASYRYSMALYILIDHPEMGVMDCIRESKRITQGHKGELFVLDLSFLGWNLLASAPYVGYLVSVWVTPYIALTHALYYERLSGHVSDGGAVE